MNISAIKREGNLAQDVMSLGLRFGAIIGKARTRQEEELLHEANSKGISTEGEYGVLLLNRNRLYSKEEALIKSAKAVVVVFEASSYRMEGKAAVVKSVVSLFGTGKVSMVAYSSKSLCVTIERG